MNLLDNKKVQLEITRFENELFWFGQKILDKADEIKQYDTEGYYKLYNKYCVLETILRATASFVDHYSRKDIED